MRKMLEDAAGKDNPGTGGGDTGLEGGQRDNGRAGAERIDRGKPTCEQCLNKGICKFYGDLDKAVEAACNANLFSPCDDGATAILKVADHPMMVVSVRCKKFRRESTSHGPGRLYW